MVSAYGMSEGLFTGSCGHSTHLPDDLCLLEPVTTAGQPVAPGQRCDKVLLTNLYNPVLPLIRFEVTDELTVLGGVCPCGSVFRRIADLQGRLDDTFTYDGAQVSVHPHVFRLRACRLAAECAAAERHTVAGQLVAGGGSIRVGSRAAGLREANHRLFLSG